MIPFSKHSPDKVSKEEMVDSRVTPVGFLKLHLRINLLDILTMFMKVITKITISIPEKSSVAIARKGESFERHVHFKPATISIWPYF